MVSHSLHILDYWRVIKNRISIILTLFFLTILTTYGVVTYLMVEMYESTAEIKVTREDPDIEIWSRTMYQVHDPIFFRSEIEMLKSKTVLLPVLEKLHLREVWVRRRGWPLEKMSKEKAFELLRDRVDITEVRNSDVLKINVISEDPREAAAIANTLVAIYTALRKDREEEKSVRGLDSIEQEIEAQRLRYQEAQQKVEVLREKLHLEVDSQGAQVIEEEWKRHSVLLDEAKTDYEGRRIRLEELLPLSSMEFLDALHAIGGSDEQMAALRHRQLLAEATIQQLLNNGLGEDHPRVQAHQAEHVTMRKQLDRMIEGKKKAFAIDLRISKERKDRLKQEVDTLAEQVRQQTTEKIVPYREAVQNRDQQLELLRALELSKSQKAVESSIISEPIKVISVAEPSDLPFRPRKGLSLLAAGVIGLGLGLGFAFFIEYLDTSVKTLDEAEQLLGLPVLAMIPRRSTSLSQDNIDSFDAESYRILQAKIQLGLGKEGGKALALMSGAPGEGKSTTTQHLAQAAAQAGQSVIIIDADLRRPTMHFLWGQPAGFGLADLFRGEGSLASLIQATSHPRLHWLPAGQTDPHQVGAFPAKLFQEILSELKKHYDLVLVDTPPILGVSDGSLIAHEVDSSILIIQHRRYPKEISLRAKRSIEEIGGRWIGVVLNAVSFPQEGSYDYTSSYNNRKTPQGKKPSASVSTPFSENF